MGEAKAKKMNALKKQTTEIENGGMGFFAAFIDARKHLKQNYSEAECSYIFEERVVVYVDYEVIKLKNRLIAILFQMKQLGKKQNTVLNQFEQNLHSHFTILYGMCSSHSSFIFSAFTGSSLARILS